MIEFVTLFLGGLVTDTRTVEFMAGDPVAIVEVLLGGELEERLEAPPWKLELDFGYELSPHLIEAVALDASERELERQQIVWLEGLHLPQSVELRPGIEGIELVE